MASLGHVAIGMLAGRLLHRPLGAADAGAGTPSPTGEPTATPMAEATVAPTPTPKPPGVLLPMAVFSLLSLLPDFDYFGVALGVPNSGPAGHRGATHSMLAPLIAAALAGAIAPFFRLPRRRLAIFAGLVAGSHLLLDAMTMNSRGVPLLWPLTAFHRVQLPWRPIPNAPCGLAYISREGLHVALVELVQFFPILAYAVWPRLFARAFRRGSRAVTQPSRHSDVGAKADSCRNVPSQPTPTRAIPL